MADCPERVCLVRVSTEDDFGISLDLTHGVPRASGQAIFSVTADLTLDQAKGVVADLQWAIREIERQMAEDERLAGRIAE